MRESETNDVAAILTEANADIREVMYRQPTSVEETRNQLDAVWRIFRYAALDAALEDNGEADTVLRVVVEGAGLSAEISRAEPAPTADISAAGQAIADSMPRDAVAVPPTPRQLDCFIRDGCPREALEAAGERLSLLIQPPPGGRVMVERFTQGGLLGVLQTEEDDDPAESEWHISAADCWVIAKAKRGNPLVPLLRAWCDRPRPARVSRRTTERILPARLAMAGDGDSRAGKLFSHAAHSAASQDGLVLPGFPHELQAPALPLALYDLGLGASTSSQNGPAPLALRLWVEAILSVMQKDRHGDHPVILEIPLRQLLARLYPRGRPRAARYWPRLMEAVESLDSMAARVPWYDPDTKRGGLRRVVSVGDIPRGPEALDDIVRIVVDLPPGSEKGPQVPDSLPGWGAQSAKAYRALLNLAYWWHNPGVTIRPIAKRTDGKGRLWVPSDHPEHYSNMSDAELVEIVFPTSKVASFRVLKARAREVLTQLEAAGELRIIKGKVLPPRRHRSEGQTE